MKKPFNQFSLRIGLANDTTIRSWSFGEVTKAETINYKSEKPVPSGLFCEKIFGPVKDNECACGKYRRIKYKGKVCNSCGVLVTESIVRRRRLGHIELHDPIVHVWFYRTIPSPVSIVLAIDQSNLEQLIQYKAYAVVENDQDPDIKIGEIIDFQYSVATQETKQMIRTKELLRKLIVKTRDRFASGTPERMEADTFLFELESGENATFFLEEFIHFINESSFFKLETGGSAIEQLLKSIDLTGEIERLKKRLSKTKIQHEQSNSDQRRLKLLNNFYRTGQKLEWMTTRTIPVLPPELRPIVHLEGGRFATSGINKLYNELIIRKNRLQKHQEKFSPLFMVNQLRALVQEAADVLFDKDLANRGKRMIDPNDGNTRSIAENLKGKTGRFRSNLLGKRIDYSAGSVIVGGPQLKLNECGLPRDIAVVLFRAMIIGKLLKRELAVNKKAAEKIVDEQEPIIWDILEELVKGYPLLLNRAPTLHRLGIQGFFPRLTRGKAIQLHPLVTTAFNADFDGDRMSVYLPLTEVAKQEVKEIIMSNHNLLNPRNGQLIVIPSQDMILGIYYLTSEEFDKPLAGSYYVTPEFAEMTYHSGKIDLHTPIFLLASSLNKPNLIKQSGFFQTTVGKVIFNKIFGNDFPYIANANWKEPIKFYPLDSNLNSVIKEIKVAPAISKSVLSDIVHKLFEEKGESATVEVLDKLKDLGFKYSTRSGTSISFFDLNSYKTKKESLFAETEIRLLKLKEIYNLGGITKTEARIQRIQEWTSVKEKVEKELEKQFIQGDLHHSIYSMVDSGARGSLSNLTQLVGMRGLMVNTRGHIIETPIKSSLTDGLDYLEFFISTYGARKGMVDTALKTADSGYLTRRLIDVAHDFYITSDDCRTKKGFIIRAIVYKKLNSEMISLGTRVYSRITAAAIVDANGQEILAKGKIIGKKEAAAIDLARVPEVKIRSILTCAEPRGSCQKCFGLDLAKNKLINRGQAIGILAAQSIGEPATQLTMRTFHTGGVSDASDITQGLPRVIQLFDVISPKKNIALLSQVKGEVTKVIEVDNQKFNIHVETENGEKIIPTPAKSVMNVAVGDQVVFGTFLTEGVANLKELLDITRDQNIVADYIIEEVQKVYYLQGIELADKYIEIIVRKILSINFIIDPGDSNYTIGEEETKYRIDQINAKLIANKQKPIKHRSLIKGTKARASKTFSFLSAASFQGTTQVLIRAVLENRTDELYGLKENVIVGNMIPVGTGSIFPENWITNEQGEKINPHEKSPWKKHLST